MQALATEDTTALVVEVAVRGIGAEELRDLLDQSRQNGRKLEVARQCLGGAQKGALLGDSSFVLSQEPGHVNRKPDLARDGFRQRDLFRSPSSRHRAMQGEYTDQAVEDEDRNGEHGPGIQLEQRLATTERRVVELGRSLNVPECDGLAAAHREVRSRQSAGPFDRPQGGRVPLVSDRDILRRTEPDETAVDTERDAGLLHRDA